MKKKATHCLIMMLMAMVAPWLAACSDVIYDDEGNCEVTYQLQFIYDRNMKFADAFAHEVKSVRVYVFDETDQLVWTTTESGDDLASGNYRLKMPLQPGNYHIVAWCGADNNPGDEHFRIAPAADKVTCYADVACRLDRLHDAEGNAYTAEKLHPLFHGETHLLLPDYGNEGGTYTYPIHLTKDTNSIKVILQHLSGEDIDVDKFNFFITDNNGSMASDNSILPDETIRYDAHDTYAGTAGVEVKNPEAGAKGTRMITNVSIAQAEFTIPRMMTDHARSLFLNITRKDDGIAVVKDLPVIDYALLVRTLENANIGNQEYLDRQDEYSMVFFLDANYEWVSSCILINSWRIVLQPDTLGS